MKGGGPMIWGGDVVGSRYGGGDPYVLPSAASAVTMLAALGLCPHLFAPLSAGIAGGAFVGESFHLGGANARRSYYTPPPVCSPCTLLPSPSRCSPADTREGYRSRRDFSRSCVCAQVWVPLAVGFFLPTSPGLTSRPSPASNSIQPPHVPSP